jgi:PhnB protein
VARNPPEGYPRITPYLLYEDADGALEFLARAFGFREHLRYTEPDGTVSHAEARLEDGVVTLGDPGPDFRSAKHGGGPQQVFVYLVDVDAHCERAAAAGATIVLEPVDQPFGARVYAAEDPEGNRWSFGQHLRDVAPEEWGATPAG